MKLYRSVASVNVATCNECPCWRESDAVEPSYCSCTYMRTDAGGLTLPVWCPLPDVVLEAQGSK